MKFPGDVKTTDGDKTDGFQILGQIEFGDGLLHVEASHHPAIDVERGGLQEEVIVGRPHVVKVMLV